MGYLLRPTSTVFRRLTYYHPIRNVLLRYMNPQELMRIQMALEGIGFDTDGRLVRVPSPQPDDLPRYYLARIRGEWLRYCRYDVPESEWSCLNDMPPSQVSSEALVEIAESDEHEIWQGRSYVFPEQTKPPSNCEVEERNGDFCIVIEGKVMQRLQLLHGPQRLWVKVK